MKVDRAFAKRPDLRARFEQRAADLGVTGNMLWQEMNAAGLSLGRSAVYEWRRRFAVAFRHRPYHSMRARVCRAALKLQPAGLHELAGRLRVPLEQPDDEARLTPRDLPSRLCQAIARIGRKRLYQLAASLGVEKSADFARSVAEDS